MAEFSFSTIEEALLFVSAKMSGDNAVLLCKDTGEIRYPPDVTGIDEAEDEEDLDWDQWVEVPHKNDLDLGRNLGFEFVEGHLPDGHECVRQVFRRQGAYARFNALFERRGLLQAWYDVENSREAQRFASGVRIAGSNSTSNKRLHSDALLQDIEGGRVSAW